MCIIHQITIYHVKKEFSGAATGGLMTGKLCYLNDVTSISCYWQQIFLRFFHAIYSLISKTSLHAFNFKAVERDIHINIACETIFPKMQQDLMNMLCLVSDHHKGPVLCVSCYFWVFAVHLRWPPYQLTTHCLVSHWHCHCPRIATKLTNNTISYNVM
jgi:hypothetical protein